MSQPLPGDWEDGQSSSRPHSNTKQVSLAIPLVDQSLPQLPIGCPTACSAAFYWLLDLYDFFLYPNSNLHLEKTVSAPRDYIFSDCLITMHASYWYLHFSLVHYWLIGNLTSFLLVAPGAFSNHMETYLEDNSRTPTRYLPTTTPSPDTPWINRTS